MILLAILALILISFIMVGALAIVIGGGLTFIVFGDLIACIAVIVWIMRIITKRRKR